MDAELATRFAIAWAEHDGRLHRCASLEDARSTARELIGDAPVARWADPQLDDVAASEAPPAAAAVSLVLADLAIAETGQIGLCHGTGRPRAAGVLPSRQVVLLPQQALADSLADGLTRFYGESAAPSNLVLVAGPSRTADIEQRMIMGVHAPREIDVVLYLADERS